MKVKMDRQVPTYGPDMEYRTEKADWMSATYCPRIHPNDG